MTAVVLLVRVDHARAAGPGVATMTKAKRLILVFDDNIDFGLATQDVAKGLQVETEAAISVQTSAVPDANLGSTLTVRVESAFGESNVAMVAVTVQLGAMGELPRQVVDLRDIPMAKRARVLSLAIAEFVRSAAQGEVAIVPTAGSNATVAEPTDADSQADAPVTDANASGVNGAIERSQTEVFATTGFRSSLQLAIPLLEARATLTAPLGESGRFRARVDVSYLIGTHDDALGTVQTRMVSGGLGLSVREALAPFAFELGPRLEIGAVSAKGLPGGADTRFAEGNAASVMASIDSHVRVVVHKRFMIAVGLEVGTVLAGLDSRADARHVGGMTGIACGLRTGLGLAL